MRNMPAYRKATALMLLILVFVIFFFMGKMMRSELNLGGNRLTLASDQLDGLHYRAHARSTEIRR